MGDNKNNGLGKSEDYCRWESERNCFTCGGYGHIVWRQTICPRCHGCGASSRLDSYDFVKTLIDDSGDSNDGIEEKEEKKPSEKLVETFPVPKLGSRVWVFSNNVIMPLKDPEPQCWLPTCSQCGGNGEVPEDNQGRILICLKCNGWGRC